MDLIRIEREEGLSGTLAISERPALRAVLEAVETGTADAIVVKALDRIGRRVAVSAAFFEALDQAGAEFVSITEPAMSSELLRSIFSGIAAEERKRILDRTSSGRIAKAATGGFAGGRVPFGYRLVGRGRSSRLEIETASAKVVKSIFRERAAGATYGSIAADLDTRQITAPRGKGWRPATVYKIVSNPIYKGTTRWREGAEVLATTSRLAIVAESLFRRCQATNPEPGLLPGKL